ncbi:MAG: hypothetical protein LJE84_00780, partial [Gammaproteobacteria bacterium]|nr:hypothetical protein [Gammaproteobacteria bacterium]
VPDKALAFGEIFRVLKPGGRIQISDIIINTNTEALEKSKTNPRLWAECIVGALQADLYKQTFVDAGFADVVEHRRSDYFGQSSNEATRKIAASFTAESMTLSARKP